MLSRRSAIWYCAALPADDFRPQPRINMYHEIGWIILGSETAGAQDFKTVARSLLVGATLDEEKGCVAVHNVPAGCVNGLFVSACISME